jgi:hypothetical protein
MRAPGAIEEIVMQIDLGQARRRAKELLAAARAGDEDASGWLRADREPRLADAQRAVAADLGFASWPALVAACAAAGEEVRSEAVRTTELAYMPGRRHATAERAVRELDWNVNRDGVVFMQTLEGRDLDWFVRRTAEVSLAVLGAILDVEG